MDCDVCNKPVTGKLFSLEITINKLVLTIYGYGDLKQHKEIHGHYHCMKKIFESCPIKDNCILKGEK